MAYDGTAYCGFQIQPNCTSIQGVIEQSLSTIFKTEVKINYAGRTDAGVHALGQVIDFKPPFYIENGSLKRALNSKLPRDIRVLKIFEVSDSFHSRYSARFREYLYFCYTGEVLAPFLRNYVWHVKGEVDFERIKKITQMFVGRRDFRFVANEDEGKNCVKEVYFFRVKRFRDFLVFHVRADGFLRGMVRNMVGLSIGAGLMHLQKDIGDNIIFQVGNVKSHKAPACGLFFRRAGY